MTRYASVVFLRSANVGVANRLDSRELAALVAAETGTPVTHYLQSGNLVVDSPQNPTQNSTQKPAQNPPRQPAQNPPRQPGRKPAQKAAQDAAPNTAANAALNVASSDATAAGRAASDALAAVVDRVIRTRWGYELNPIVRSGEELARLSAANPFADAEAKQVHLLMWEAPGRLPNGTGSTTNEASINALLGDVEAGLWPGDRLSFDGTNAWIRFAGPSHASKLPQELERRLGVRTTARNAATIAALASRAER